MLHESIASFRYRNELAINRVIPRSPAACNRQARGLWLSCNAIIQLNMEDSTFHIDYDDCEHSEFGRLNNSVAQALGYSTAGLRDLGVLGIEIELAGGGRSIVLVGTRLIHRFAAYKVKLDLRTVVVKSGRSGIAGVYPDEMQSLPVVKVLHKRHSGTKVGTARWSWKHKQPDIKPDQMVLIRDDSTSPMKWPMGRVTVVDPGSDGACRAAEIKQTRS
ncbi:hypothetical protein EVAR_100314_1 [Eumeta japonica]|uniref:DUF5641 domain-containing protein n=1 Tax=Eumeta variegata TaxID=151549 RepID=A0A4C1SGV0_EUMVA|nr:hypothetical protein EVAR_100314_1 [Eumeta japonica]